MLGRGNRVIGKTGEKFALKFLKDKGYEILGVNFCTPFGELDLVTRSRGVIAFVEVKTRTTYSFGPPYLSVTDVKKQHIIRNALFYLKSRRLTDSNWRIDIVSVNLNPADEVEKIEVFENAVEDPYI